MSEWIRTGWGTRWRWRIFMGMAGWRGIQISIRERPLKNGLASALGTTLLWYAQSNSYWSRRGPSMKVTRGRLARARSPIFWGAISDRESNPPNETAGDNGIAPITRPSEWI